jgi:hypothetical protein
MSIELDFVRSEIKNQSYEITLHADEERIADELMISELEFVLVSGMILEHYPGDKRGESCLVLGFSPEGIPVHVVCGKNSLGHLVLITVYIPSMPKWKDAYTRNQ